MVKGLRAAGYDVLAIDALQQGEYRAPGDPLTHVTLAHTRAHAGYTFGYNLPLPAERAQDVLAAIEAAHALAHEGDVVLVARGAAAGWGAGASWLAGSRVARAAYQIPPDSGSARWPESMPRTSSQGRPSTATSTRCSRSGRVTPGWHAAPKCPPSSAPSGRLAETAR